MTREEAYRALALRAIERCADNSACVDCITDAILAAVTEEHERCVRIAETIDPIDPGRAWGERIAAAIRGRS